MATAASLAGIEQFGLAWRLRLTVHIPRDIPSLFDACETNADVLILVDKIAKSVFNDLKSITTFDYGEYNRHFSFILAELKERFEIRAFIDIDAYLSGAASDEKAELAESEKRLLMDDIAIFYDWADYYRILLINRN